uniref:Uncharacterized protein n=1 Tax=Anopheles darlingi TaxID=43151 RepID=A0A2M4DD91_ANODA
MLVIARHVAELVAAAVAAVAVVGEAVVADSTVVVVVAAELAMPLLLRGKQLEPLTLLTLDDDDGEAVVAEVRHYHRR